MKIVASLLGLLFGSSALATPLETGAPAPELTVTLENGETLDLSKAYAGGPVLVYFYPKADTPGCTKQACNLRDHFATLTDAGVTVLGVSADKVAAQKAFREKYGLPFHLVADPEGKLIEAFGVPTKMGFANRQTFLIVDGKVAWRDLKATPTTQAQDALAALEKR